MEGLHAVVTDFAAGQRWSSDMEPELGMGVVQSIDGRRVTVTFPKSNLTRIYAIESVPLRRVVFHQGDRVAGDSGVSLTVTAIDREDGLNVYCGDGVRLREDRLADTLTVDRPADRLMATQRDALPLFDHCGIVMEPIEARVFRLMPDHRYAQPLPGFRPSGLMVTTDRAIALTREDLDFLTWDHPLVAGAMEFFFGSGTGNVAFAHLNASGRPALFVEMVFLLEAAAPPDLYLDRFLPPTPIRVVVDHQLNNAEHDLPDGLPGVFTDGPAALFAKTLPAVSHRIPDMVQAGRLIARSKALPLIEAANQAVGLAMNEAVDRLETLGMVNAAISDAEITLVKKERDAILDTVSTAAVRLDAIRLIIREEGH